MVSTPARLTTQPAQAASCAELSRQAALCIVIMERKEEPRPTASLPAHITWAAQQARPGRPKDEAQACGLRAHAAPVQPVIHACVPDTQPAQPASCAEAQRAGCACGTPSRSAVVSSTGYRQLVGTQGGRPAPGKQRRVMTAGACSQGQCSQLLRARHARQHILPSAPAQKAVCLLESLTAQKPKKPANWLPALPAESSPCARPKQAR